ncbi:DNA/RNA non-specific endonuclease [Actinomadura chibensis]|uniref:Type VII secretion system protein EssD-like domain-containing protein n=1 Tax=Actinomadura chibensis TaxID=392828 RepID=A0A5D0NGT8_9ACTN|nr:DNA/RNA non-specific endonuclease [Actinomadura chibensis]TYB43614.1 hypothetical protein FXF69_27930 [Actinomadura chibensis]
MIVPDQVLAIMAKVQPDVVEAEAHDLKKAATGIRDAGADVHSTWQGLSAFYKAPEADRLFSATTAVRDDSAMFAGQLEKVTGALTTYAAETRVIKNRLTGLYMQAVTFVNKTYAEDDDWQKNKDLVRQNNDLINAVDAQAIAFQNAQEKAAQSIYSAYGGTAPALPTGKGGGERPWGSPEKADLPWYEDMWNGGVSLFKGFFGDGLWGDASGIWNLVTSPGKWWDAYKSIMALGLPALPLVGPVAMMVPSVRHKVFETWKGFGKSFVAWDRWKQDPARAFGNTLYNVVTTIVPVGKAGSAGKLGKLSRAGARVGDVVDPVSLSIRTAAKLPKVSDIAAQLTGKIGDFTGKVKVGIPKITVPWRHPDPVPYRPVHHADIPDRIPEWVQREHRLDAEFQVRNSRTPEMAGARPGEITNTVHDPSRPIPETAPHGPAHGPGTTHHGDLGGPREGDLGGPPHDPGSPVPPHGHGGPPHDPSSGGHGRTPEDQVIEKKDPLSPKRSKPFGAGVELEANKRYIVTDQGGRYRGVFITDDHGVIREVHTWSRSVGKWRPDLRNPLPNAEYHVDDNWVFHTDHHGRTVSAEGQLHHPGSDDARRMTTDQRNAGYEGAAEYRKLNQQILDNFEAEHGRLPMAHEVQLYHDVKWNGGHLIGTALGGPGERINLVAMLEKLNQAQKGTTPLNNYRKMEEYLIAILDRPHPPRVHFAIQAHYPGGGRVPTEISIRYKVDDLPARTITYDNMPSMG